MLDSFLTFINQHTPDLKQQRTLLAVSGGIDSVVMVHLFASLGLPAGIAHCNFGLRGAESDGDEAFVQALAQHFNLPYFVTHPDVHAASSAGSTQMAARSLRYEWFENIRSEHDYQWIATAHHANDSLETLLLNLARGTGLAGLCGIAPVNGRLIRPMLFSSRDEVRAYAAAQGITWREDRTNATDDYHRNKIRHHVMPVLVQLNPSLETTFNASSERLRAAHALLNAHLEDWKSEAVTVSNGEIRVPIREIVENEESVYRLWFLLEPYGFPYSQMRPVLSALSGIPGKLFSSGSHTLLVDRTDLILRANRDSASLPPLEISAAEGTFSYLGRSITFSPHISDDFSKTSIAVDADKLAFPLLLRKWQTGDVFQPFGMAGKSKKVSDLQTDLKMDRFEKERVVILENGNGEIIWVVGLRADERFRVGDGSRHALRISVEDE